MVEVWISPKILWDDTKLRNSKAINLEFFHMKIYKYNKSNYLSLINYSNVKLHFLFGSTILIRSLDIKSSIKEKVLSKCKNAKMARDMIVIYNRSKNNLFVRVMFFKNKHDFLYHQRLSKVLAVHSS